MELYGNLPLKEYAFNMAKNTARKLNDYQVMVYRSLVRELNSKKPSLSGVKNTREKTCSMKRKVSESSHHRLWHSWEARKKKKRKQFSARDELHVNKSRRKQYVVTHKFTMQYNQEKLGKAHNLFVIMVGKANTKTAKRSKASESKKSKAADNPFAPLDDDTPLSELKKRQSMQKKVRKTRIKERRSRSVKNKPVAKTNSKSNSTPKARKKEVVTVPQKRTPEVSVKKRKSSSKDDKVQESTKTDPRIVPLPDDASEVSDLSDQLQKTTIEIRQEAESKKIDDQYQKAMKKRVLTKGDVYKDQNGRLTTMGDEVSVEDESSESSESSSSSGSDTNEKQVEDEKETDSGGAGDEDQES